MKKLFYLAALCMLAFTSCSTEVEAPATGTDVMGDTRLEFVASVGQTRSTLGPDGSTVSFTLSDALSLFSVQNANIRLAATSINSGSASFVGNGKEDDLYYAVYPFQAGAQKVGTTITGFTLPEEQIAVKNSFDADALMLFDETTTNEFHFSHMTSLLKFTVKFGEGVTDVKDIIFFAGGPNALAGDVTINTETGTLTTTECSGSSVVLNGNFEDGGVYYLAVAPNTYSFIVLSAEDNNGMSLFSRDKFAPVTFEKGKVYDLGIVSLKNNSVQVSEANTEDEVNQALTESTTADQPIDEVQVNVGEEGEEVTVNEIVIPQEITTSEQNKDVTLNFQALPVATTAAAEIVVTDLQVNPTDTDSKSTVEIAIPEATAEQDAPAFIINLPNSTVTLDAVAETATYAKVIATTADNTLKVATGVTIEELIIKQGNVVVSGTVNNISADEDTIVYLAGKGSVATIDPSSPGHITIMNKGSEFNAGNTGFVWE